MLNEWKRVGLCVGSPGRSGRRSEDGAALDLLLAIASRRRVEAIVTSCPDADPDARERVRSVTRVLEELESRGIVSGCVASDPSDGCALSATCVAEGLDAVLLGRAAARRRPLSRATRDFLRTCRVPVWIARPGCPQLPKRIVVATDLEQAGDTALVAAAEIANELDSELHVVHAFSLPPSVQLSGESVAYAAVHRATAEERVHTLLDECGPVARLRLHVGLGSPSRSVMRVVAELAADLLVLGNVSRRGVPGALIGNTAERLLRAAEVPLLVLRPDGHS